MQRTAEEQKILNGERGGLLPNTEMLVGCGDCFDTTDIVPVNSVPDPSMTIPIFPEVGRNLRGPVFEAPSPV